MEIISEIDVRIVQPIYVQQGRVEVYRVNQINTNRDLCMKKVYVKDIQEANYIYSQSASMINLFHENIISPVSVCLGGHEKIITHILIFTEFCPEGDLENLIQRQVLSRQYFPESTLLMYLQQLVAAFRYMQDKQTAHRDIKPQNILVCENATKLKVGDLGSAINKNDYQGMAVAGTPLYLSPALRASYNSGGGFFGVNHDVFKSDVYSLGLTFLYMASLRLVNDLCTLENLQEKINKRIAELSYGYPNLVEYLSVMLKVEEGNREDFKTLDRMIQKGKKTGALSEFNWNKLNNGKLLMIRAKCTVCEKEKKENEIFLYHSGIMCSDCWKEFEKGRVKRVL